MCCILLACLVLLAPLSFGVSMWATNILAPEWLNQTLVTMLSVLYVLHIAVMASFIGTTCWNEGTFRAGGAQAGYFGNLFPVFAGALAILILGEELRWYHVAGATSVLAGIWLATAQHARQAGKG